MLFDFDYTLADGTEGIVLSINYALKTLGLEEKPYDEVRLTIGMHLSAAFHQLTGITEPEPTQKFCNEYIKKADEILTPLTILLPGVRPLMQLLTERGIKIGVVTNKAAYRVADAFKAFGMPTVLDIIIGCDDVRNPKPAPDPLLIAIERLGLEKSSVIYCGDSYIDALAAQNAGVDFIGVLTGTTSQSEFEKYPHIVILENAEAVLKLFS